MINIKITETFQHFHRLILRLISINKPIKIIIKRINIKFKIRINSFSLYKIKLKFQILPNKIRNKTSNLKNHYYRMLKHKSYILK